MLDFFRKVGVAWLERRGLSSVAASVEASFSARGNLMATVEVAKRALNSGQYQQALDAVNRALEAMPNDPGLWCIRGTAHRLLNYFDMAQQDYERSLELNSDFLQALNNLGELHLVRNRPDKALLIFDRALFLAPDYVDARVNRVAALIEMNQLDGTLAEARALTQLAPHSAEAFGNLGNVLLRLDSKQEALVCFQRALEIRPGYPEAHFNLAILQGATAELAKALGYLEKQIKERGPTAFRFALLASAYQGDGQLGKAEACCKKALELDSENLAALMTLAATLSAAGNPTASIDVYRSAQKIHPGHPGLGSNINFESNYLPFLSRAEIFQRHSDWAQQHEIPLLNGSNRLPVSAAVERKLRIGYVSGDFCSHPVGYLLSDVVQHHDSTAFEIVCFSTSLRPDDLSERIQQTAGEWIDVSLLDSDALDARLREARVDVLIDLSGHTAFNRLLAFARRPAPVQATWIGYFHSTGMSSIDYFITDPHTSPVGSGQLFSEIPVFLPHTRFCYAPPDYAPTVTCLPAQRDGKVTFGSFNRLAKISDRVLDAWAAILRLVPNGRLVLKSAPFSEETICKHYLAQLGDRGIAADRIELRSASGHRDMLAEYGDIDIALDTFPFNGGMTTLEALWMGVPVVTIAGDTVVSRQTVSALANLGLAEELAFDSVVAYVDGAVALAQKPARLAELRSELRPRMAASPLRDSEAFTRDLEALYRRMWGAWCDGKRLASDVA
jgi:predicted O-linked N-acetylglucosamine transferase (SPINDLY family)